MSDTVRLGGWPSESQILEDLPVVCEDSSTFNNVKRQEGELPLNQYERN